MRKPWLDVGGRTILARTVDAARAAGFVDVIVLGATDAEVAALGVPAVPDATPDAGPLVALAGALTTCPDGLVLVPGDAPFLVPALLAHLAAAPGSLVPVLDHVAQPQLARWSAAAGPAARRLVANGRRALRDLLDATPWTALAEPAARALDPGLTSFLDVDTPEALAEARRRA